MRAGILVSLVLALLIGEPSLADDDAKLLALNFQEFDQSAQGGWRKLAQAGKCTAAANVIERYAEANADRLAPYEKFSLAFHAGQMYGMSGSRDAAVKSLKYALNLFPNGPNDGYLKALIAFSRDDKQGLAKAKAVVSALDDSNPAKQIQMRSIDDLIEYFGCPLASVGRERQSATECPAVPSPCS